MRSAKQLIDALAACTVCGKEHKPRKIGENLWSWAARDGHTYRTRLHEMTNHGSTGLIQKLRELAKS